METSVKIANENMSIIEAIEYKQILSDKINEFAMLIAYIDQAVKMKEKEEAKTEEKAQRTLESIYGTAKNSLPKDTIEQTLNSFRQAYKIEVISPMSMEEAIAKKAEFESILSEIDLTLSEINAKTMIEV